MCYNNYENVIITHNAIKGAIMSTETVDLNKIHKQFAVEYNNKTWYFFDMENRTDEQNLEMIHMAHTSRFHWGIVGNAMNLERGEWLVARAYSEAGVQERAIFHGELCLKICIENKIGDFDLAFAYEGLVRANKLGDQVDTYNKYKKLALDAAEHIEKPEDKTYFLEELNKL